MFLGYVMMRVYITFYLLLVGSSWEAFLSDKTYVLSNPTAIFKIYTNWSGTEVIYVLYK